MPESRRNIYYSLVVIIAGGVLGTSLTKAMDPWWPTGAWQWWALCGGVVVIFIIGTFLWHTVGNKGRDQTRKRQPRQPKFYIWIAATITWAIAVMCFWNALAGAWKSDASRIAEMAQSELWAEVSQYRSMAKHCLQDGVHLGLVRAVKAKMHNPESFTARRDSFAVGPIGDDGTRRAAFEFQGRNLYDDEMIPYVAVALMVNDTCKAILLSIASNSTMEGTKTGGIGVVYRTDFDAKMEIVSGFKSPNTNAKSVK